MTDEVQIEGIMLQKPTTHHFVDLIRMGFENDHENGSNPTIQKI